MATLVTLHGFLGSPSDWYFIQDANLLNNPSCFKAPGAVQVNLDLFDPTFFSPKKGLWEAGRRVNAFARKIGGEKILIAYSLGGRIALHALLEDPSIWLGGVVVSTNPGLASPEEKKIRVQEDAAWAFRFRHHPWEKVLSDWDAQPVFAGRTMERNSKRLSPEIVAESLEGWSLGGQDDLSLSLQSLFVPILWMTGEVDYKFTSIAKDVKLAHPLSKRTVIRDASHRVPWEQKELFIKETQQFIYSLTKRRNDDCDS